MKNTFLKKLPISTKISIIAGIGTFIAISALILFSTKILKEKLIEKGKIEAISIAKNFSSKTSSLVDLAFLTSENVAFAISDLELPLQPSRIQQIITKTLQANPYLKGASLLIKPQFIDTSSISNNFFTNNKHDKVLHLCYDLKNKNKIDYKEKNNIKFNDKKSLVIFKINKNNKSETILTSNIPIFKDSLHIANVSFHFSIKSILNKSLDSLFNGNLSLCIINENGLYISNSSNENIVGKSIADNVKERYSDIKTQLAYIKQAKTKIYNYNENSKFFLPIEFKKYKHNWQIRISIPTRIIVEEATNGMLKKAVIGITFSIIIIIIVLIFVRKSLNPLNKLINIIQKISKGELYHKLNSKNSDEIGQIMFSFNNMTAEITKIVNNINKNSYKLAKASLKAKNAAVQVSESVSEQAASVEEISSSTEEILASIIQNTQSSKETEKQAAGLVKSIEIVKKSFEETLQSMQQIVGKIAVINEIASRTDLLAINAAIEAARAGEVGKGFAVVAQEIRKLAESSIASAKMIDQLSNISTEKSKKSVDLLNEVVFKVQANANSMNKIKNSSKEQNLGIQQVNESINQLNITTQQNSALADTLSQNAEIFNKMAKDLQKIISFFKLKNK